MTTFKKYVDDEFQGNVAKAARFLDEGVETVRAWYKGRNNPRPAKMRDIARRTGGAVTLADWFPEVADSAEDAA